MRSAEDVEIEGLKKADSHLDERIDRIERRVGVIETAIAWLIGASVGVAGLAAAMKSGILKFLTT